MSKKVNFDSALINYDEKFVYNLRSVYKKYGYSQFKMSKFEEYDFYAQNKDYLLSENIITFTDTNGKLMALKPDVTLSIIKNSSFSDSGLSKVFYDENVYRVSKSTGDFKEITQVGLECVGDIDTYNIFEVIMLAAKSLESITDDYIIDISNMDIIHRLIETFEIDEKCKKLIIKSIKEKNIPEIEAVCKNNDVPAEKYEKLKKLISLYGNLDNVVDEVKDVMKDIDSPSVDLLEQIVTLSKQSGISDKLRIDFSVISDSNYYNGFVFHGYIKGISSWILSGGQYDNLLKKMKINGKAIGFAVYLDMLEGYGEIYNEYDVDCVVLYDDATDVVVLNNTVKELSETKSVIALKKAPQNIKYKSLYKVSERGVEELETNA